LREKTLGYRLLTRLWEKERIVIRSTGEEGEKKKTASLKDPSAASQRGGEVAQNRAKKKKIADDGKGVGAC